MAGREDRGDQRLSQEDLNCSCCFELMVEPTTLNCGHSFCRFCLAQWWSASKHATCPECRQPWAGFPKVNIVLRKTIKVLFPREAVERQRYQEFSPDYNSLLSEFESLNVNEGRNHSGTSSGLAQVVHRQQVNFSLSRIVLIILSILGVIMFAYQVLNLFMKPKDILVEKTVLQWTAEDVAKWVNSLGNWTQGYDKRFYDENIDGNLLLSLSESDLEMSLDIDVSFHRRTLMKEIETLRNLGVKSPTDIWEYKDAHPARTNFILWGLREFPRLTVVYSFFFYHEEVFQPLLCYTSELVDIEEDFNEVSLPSEEYLRFSLRLLLVPYYLIARLAMKLIYRDFWVGGIVFIYCLLMTLVECSYLKWLLFTGGWRQLPTLCRRVIGTAFVNGFLQFLMWQVLPAFVCNFAFYWMLLMAPYAAWNSFKTRWSESRVGNSPARDFCSWLWRKAFQKLRQLMIRRQF